MSTQGIGQTETIPDVDTSLPTGTQGLAMSTIASGRKPKVYRLSITVTSGAPIASLVGSDTDAGTVWGFLGDASGAINAGVALAVGTYHFVVENLGVVRRVGILLSAGAASATLTAITENGD